MPNQFEYSRVFFDRWYRPQNTILLVCTPTLGAHEFSTGHKIVFAIAQQVVGDVPPLNELMNLAERYYGKWSPLDKSGKRPMPPPIPQEPQQVSPACVLPNYHCRDIEKSSMSDSRNVP